MKNIYYLLGIQSYANHDSGQKILRYDKKRTTDYVAISEERLKKISIHLSYTLYRHCLKYFNLKNPNVLITYFQIG